MVMGFKPFTGDVSWYYSTAGVPTQVARAAQLLGAGAAASSQI